MGTMKHFTILALGSRGDVLPCVILGGALRRVGYRVRVISFENFESMVARVGLDFTAVPGNAELLLSSRDGLALIDSGQNVLKQWRALKQTFWQLTDDILEVLSQTTLWQTDAIINQLPLSLFGRSLAEKLHIPLINIAVIPLLRTTAFPMVGLPEGPSIFPGYNAITYRLAEQLVWSSYRRPINQWRRDVLGLEKRPYFGNLRALQNYPTLLGFSNHVVPRPPDWGPNVCFTGYWLPHEPEWQPPEALVQFLADGAPPVFIGFGSMTVHEPQRLTNLILEATRLLGQRLILHAGWAGLGQLPLPETVYTLDYAPYRWLFPQMAALVHHGGSGTTGFGLWAGIPTIVTPFLFDQFFWGRRIASLGVGPPPIPQKKLTTEKLVAALEMAISDKEMRQKAAFLGKKIRSENGITTAVALIQQQLD